MANKRKMSLTASKTVYSADFGNASRETLVDTLSSTNVDTEIVFGTFPAGTIIDGIRVMNDALGAGTSMQFGVVSELTDDIQELDLFGTVNTENVGITEKPIRPFKAKNQSVYLIGKVLGAAATGEVTVNVDYRYDGVAVY